MHSLYIHIGNKHINSVRIHCKYDRTNTKVTMQVFMVSKFRNLMTPDATVLCILAVEKVTQRFDHSRRRSAGGCMRLFGRRVTVVLTKVHRVGSGDVGSDHCSLPGDGQSDAVVAEEGEEICACDFHASTKTPVEVIRQYATLFNYSFNHRKTVYVFLLAAHFNGF